MTTIGSLFSGIGGLERGIEMALPGVRIAWQAENDPHALAVLARHYPTVRRYTDVKEIDGQAERPDIICGGSPCQNISNAGNREGIDGAKSVLWNEFARIVRVLRPGVVFFENVSAILGRGLARVLGDLAACGYDAVWETFKASDVGAPHRRDRLFLLAYSDCERVRELRWWRSGAGGTDQTELIDDGAGMADTGRGGLRSGQRELRARQSYADGRGADVGDGATTGATDHILADAYGQFSDERATLPGIGDETTRPIGRGMLEFDGRGSMAHADGETRRRSEGSALDQDGSETLRPRETEPRRRGGALADAESDGPNEGRTEPARERGGSDAPIGRSSSTAADPEGERSRRLPARRPDGEDSTDTHGGDHWLQTRGRAAHRWPPGPNAIQEWDGAQPAVRRSVTRLSGRLRRSDALRLLGNSVCPQQAALAFKTLAARACVSFR